MLVKNQEPRIKSRDEKLNLTKLLMYQNNSYSRIFWLLTLGSWLLLLNSFISSQFKSFPHQYHVTFNAR